MNPTLITILVIVLMAIGAAYAIFQIRKRSIKKLFEQVYDMVKQVPKQKKQGFILLMFKESMTPKKKKKQATPEQLNNPKYLEVQMILMNKILKDPTAVTDKPTKNALKLLNDYFAWEKLKNTPTTKAK